MFNSVKEFAEALLEGRKFTFREEYKYHNRYGQVFFFKEGFRWENKDDYTEGNMDETDFNSFNKVKECLNWYDNIPKQGILCWVKDSPNKEPILGVVLSYNHDSHSYPYRTNYESFIYAIPVTPEEVKQFIYQP